MSNINEAGRHGAGTQYERFERSMKINMVFGCTRKWILLLLAAVLCSLPLPCGALEPNKILVIANKNAARSVGLAHYYMQKRSIPQANLVELWITDKEGCSRKDYEERAVYKIRKHLREKDPNNQIRCLVTMYGVPLKIEPPAMTTEEKKQVADLRKNRKFFLGCCLMDG